MISPPLPCPSEPPSHAHRFKEEGRKFTQGHVRKVRHKQAANIFPFQAEKSNACWLLCDWKCHSVTMTIHFLSRKQERKFSFGGGEVCCTRYRKHNLYQKLDTASAPLPHTWLPLWEVKVFPHHTPTYSWTHHVVENALGTPDAPEKCAPLPGRTCFFHFHSNRHYWSDSSFPSVSSGTPAYRQALLFLQPCPL